MCLKIKIFRNCSYLVHEIHDAITVVENEEDLNIINEAIERISKNFISIRNILFFKTLSRRIKRKIERLMKVMCKTDLFSRVVKILYLIDFETKKVIGLIFNNLILYPGARGITEKYMENNKALLITLMRCYEHPEIIQPCAAMLRHCARIESLANIMVNSVEFFKFFEYMEAPSFDVAVDAFLSFKRLLIIHPTITSDFLKNNYDTFMNKFDKLLTSNCYVLRRLSIELLRMLLQEGDQFMINKYTSSKKNLKYVMDKMRDLNRAISVDAFLIFRLFALKTEKELPIINALKNNKHLIIKYLRNFEIDCNPSSPFWDLKAEVAAAVYKL